MLPQSVKMNSTQSQNCWSDVAVPTDGNAIFLMFLILFLPVCASDTDRSSDESDRYQEMLEAGCLDFDLLATSSRRRRDRRGRSYRRPRRFARRQKNSALKYSARKTVASFRFVESFGNPNKTFGTVFALGQR